MTGVGAAVRGPRAVRPGRSIVRLSGSLDFAAAKELRERLIDVLHRGASPLIIDLSRVPSPICQLWMIRTFVWIVTFVQP